MRLLLYACCSILLSFGLWGQGGDNIIDFLDQTAYGSGNPNDLDGILVEKIIPTSDGGSLIVGSHLNQFQDRQAYAWKVDSLANMQWFVDEGQNNSEDRFSSAIEVNGEFFLTAELSFNDNQQHQAAVFRYSSSGFLIDAIVFPDLNGNPVMLRTLALGADNQLIVGGYFVDQANNNQQVGWLTRLQINNFGLFEIPGTTVTNGLGYVVVDILKNGPGIYSVLYGGINPNEEGCGVEFILRSDLVVSKRDAQMNEISAWLVGGTTGDYFLDAVVRPDGRLACLGFTFCLGDLGNSGPLNVANNNGTLRPFWIAELDVINDLGIINVSPTLGNFPTSPGNGFESPFAIEYYNCEPNSYLVAAQFYEQGDPPTQYLDLYNVAAGSSTNYYFRAGGSNELFRMEDFTRLLNGRFHQAGQTEQGLGLVHRLTNDGCTTPFNCEALETLECNDGQVLLHNNVDAPSLLTNVDYACAPAGIEYDGPERVYRYELLPGRQLTATLRADNINFDIFVFAECPENPGSAPYTCVGSSTNGLEADGMNFDNVYLPGLDPGTYYIVVDGATSDDVGDYELTVSCYGAWQCQFQDEFTDLACGDVLTNDNFRQNGHFNRSSTYCSVSNNTSTSPHVGLTGPEHLYEVIPVVGGEYTFTLTPLSGDDDFDLYIMAADGGLIDDIFLEFCYNTTLCEFSNSSAGPGQPVTMTADLVSGQGYILIVDGRLGTEGQYTIAMNCPTNCDLIPYEIDCADLEWYNQSNGNYVFTSNRPTFTNDFEWQLNGTPVSETGITFDYAGNQLYADLSALTGTNGSIEVCSPYLQEDGCVGYCCQIICDNSIIEPYSIDFTFTDGGFLFDVSGDGVTLPEWFYFPDGQVNPTPLGEGFNAFLEAPSECVVQTIYVRYYDITTNCWRTVSEDFYLCNPYLCDEVTAAFDNANNDWVITLNDPGAGFINWRDDDTFTDFPETGNVLTINFDNECRTRNISVRYRDAAGVWRICCLSFYYCDPYDCSDVSAFYDPGVNSFILTAGIPTASTEIVWFDDDLNEVITTGTTSASLPYDGICRTRNVSIRYVDPNGVFRICCLTFEFCVEDDCDDPVFSNSCDSQTFSVIGNDNYTFNANDPNYTFDEEWYVNGSPVSETGLDYVSLADGVLGIDFAPNQNGTYEICYPFIDADGCLNYCCETYCINVIIEPYQFTHSYNATDGGFDLNLSGVAVSQVSWYYYVGANINPVELGSGPTTFLPLPSVCEVVTVYARYFDTASQCWRIISEDIFLCDPYACGDVVLNYEVAADAFSLTLSNADGATDIRWQDDETGETLATNTFSIDLPFDGECANRFVSVRYRDADGVYRICCLVFYLCDPSDCDAVEINYNAGTTAFDFSFTPNGTVTDIVWINDETGEVIATDVLSVSLPFDGDCRVRQITIRYRDETGALRICCPTYYYCDPYDCDEITVSYDAPSNSFGLVWNAPPIATDVVWVDDETGEILSDGDNVIAIVIPFDGDCRNRYISIRYRDADGVYRICCISFYFCDPYACDEIDLVYDFANNAYDIFWNGPADATNVVWMDDATGEVLANDVNAITLAPDGDCGYRFISVRYRDADGVYRICCLVFYLCDPSDCDAVEINYNAGTTAFDFTFTPNGTVSDIVWINDETGEVIATDVLSVSLPFDGDCRVRQITIRYRDETGALRICCPTYYYCDPYDCDEIDLVYDFETDGYSLFLGNNDATSIVWMDDATGEVLATNTQGIFLAPDGDCGYRFISVRYRDADGVYRICCLVFYLCDPSDCDAVEINYNAGTTAFDFSFTPNGTVSDIVWINDETGEVIATDVLSVSLSFDGDCRVRQITIRYRDETGALRICCPTYYYCDPYACDEIDLVYDFADNAYDIFWNGPADATNVVWMDDATGEVLANDVNAITLVPDGDCGYRFISVRYRDADGVYRICCLVFYLCDPSDCDAVEINYNAGTTAFDFTFTPNGTVSDIVWINDETGEVIATDVLSVSLPFDGDCRVRQITIRYRDETGALRICCPTYYYCDPYDCLSLSYTFNPGTTSFDFTFDPGGPVSDIVWTNDDTGEIIATGTLTASLPFDGECGVRNVSVRYRDADGVYRICCCRFYFCDPYDCGDIVEVFDELNQTYTLFLANNPGVTGIEWRDDDTGEVLVSGTSTLILPFDGDCRVRNISVRFVDTDGVYRICCLSFYYCNPYDCLSLSYAFNAGTNAFDFTFDPGGPVTDIVWTNDDTGEVIATGTLTASLPFDGECGVRNVSVRYRDANGVYRVCCCRFFYCDPYDCGDISESYDPDSETWTFTLENNPGVTEIVWIDDDTGIAFPSTSATLQIPFDGDCRVRNISVRFRDADGVYRICCLQFFFCNPYDCDSVVYTFDGENQQFNFSFTPTGAVSDLVWRDDDTGEILGINVLNISVPYDGSCDVRNISVRYRDVNGVWRICCSQFFFCDPFECGDVVETFDPDNTTWTFTLTNADGATNIVWTDDDTGEVFPVITSTLVIPFDGDCRVRNISVRFLDVDGIYRICCLSFYYCDPYECGDLTVDYDGPTQSWNLTFEAPADATEISWRDDLTGEILATDVTELSLVFDGVCRDRYISVRYRNALGTWTICCVVFDFCPQCELPMPSFIPTLTENLLSVENTTTGEVDSWLWSFGSVSNSTAENPGPAVLPQGSSVVCLTATNDCGSQQYCITVVVPDFENDLIFDLDDDVCGAAGEIIEIPVYVLNFDDILNFQFSIELADLSYGEIIGFDFSNLPANIVTPNGFLVGPGSATVVWADNQGESLPDDFVFMTVRIQLAAAIEAGSTPIVFSGSPTAVYAEEGNGDEVVPVLLAGNVNVCEFVDIRGNILTEDGDGIGLVNVFLNKNGAFEQVTVTDNNGAYAFNGLEAGHNYSVQPVKDINYLNGVNAGDLTRMSSHVLNEILLNSPYKRIAADVRPPNTVNSGDISRVRQLILGDVATFTDVDSWRFVEAGHLFADPDEPTSSPFPEIAVLNALMSSSISQDFIGMKMGDVNNSNDPLNLFSSPPESVGNDDLTFAFQTTETPQTGQPFVVDVTVRAFTDMIAGQLSMHWDTTALEFVGLLDLNGDLALGVDNFSFNSLEQGRLPWVWFSPDGHGVSLEDSTVLFRIEFDVLAAQGSTVSIDFGDAPTVPYFEDVVMELFPQYEQYQLTVGGTTSTHEPAAFQGWTVYPNPTQGGFYLDAGGATTEQPELVELYHPDGRLLMSWKAPAAAERFELGELPAGVYLVRLLDDGDSRLIRLVVR